LKTPYWLSVNTDSYRCKASWMMPLDDTNTRTTRFSPPYRRCRIAREH
jgi:hypothetical protein